MKPQDVSNAEIAFPARVLHLMPEWESIPAEFKHWRGTAWNQLVSRWFSSGLDRPKFEPREGIDTTKALRHLKTVMGSYEPKHEHKEAAVAYLLSLWFFKVVLADGTTCPSEENNDGVS